jgi:hypothetical protein
MTVFDPRPPVVWYQSSEQRKNSEKSDASRSTTANVAGTGHGQIKAPVKAVENYCVENDHWQT